MILTSTVFSRPYKRSRLLYDMWQTDRRTGIYRAKHICIYAICCRALKTIVVMSGQRRIN